MKNAVLVLLLLVLATFPGTTQVMEVTPEARQLAYDLTDLLGVHQRVLESAEATIDRWIANDSGLAPHRSAMLAWATSSLSPGEYAPPIARILLDTYTETELRELSDFLNSPTGQKVLEHLPGVLDRTQELGSLLMEQHKEDIGRFLLTLPQQANRTEGDDTAT